MEQLQLFCGDNPGTAAVAGFIRRVPQQKDVVDSALVQKKSSARWLVL